MPIKFVYGLCLLGGLLLSVKVPAQGIGDSLQYRQAKLDLWCETIRFVYKDNGADSLTRTLNCHSWESLRQSLQPNHLQANSFFLSIEKPSIYQGYSSYEGKLQKLIEEIGKRLKSSPSRSIDPKRIIKVDSLQASLLQVVSARPVGNSLPKKAEEVTGEMEKALIQPVNTPNAVAESQQENTILLDEEDPMDWTEIAQWALLFLLSAGLAWLWGKNSKLQQELDRRMSRRKQEISAISRIKEPTAVSPAKTNEPAYMSKPEVQSLIRSEIEKVRQQQRNLQNQRQQQRTGNVNSEKRPEGEREKPLPKQEVKKRPEPEPLQPTAKEEGKIDSGLYYDKLPFKGGFHQNQLSTHRHPDSIYSIQVLANKPDEAEFWVTEDQEVQKYAMQNGLSFFEEACDYNQVEENPSRVRNLEKGKLRKNGHLWEIEKKVKVNFE